MLLYNESRLHESPEGQVLLVSPRIRPSVHDFARRRKSNLLYVDKTRQIRHFLDHDDALLFTRPRRFGKTLLLSTIRAMYSGDASLFASQPAGGEALAIYRDAAWDWQQQRPVLHLDMSTLEPHAEGFARPLADRVEAAADDLGMTGHYIHKPDNPSQALANLIAALHRRCPHPDREGLVILVDEYDAPVLNHMHLRSAPRGREQLANFYGTFKSQSAHIEKLVLTGVTRFVRDGLWSKLNHVTDVTQYPQFNDLVGFTDSELDTLWCQMGPPSPAAAAAGGDWPALSREAWREWYDGYLFAAQAEETIYNPFAIMHSLDTGHLDDYWSHAGHLQAVEDLLQETWESGRFSSILAHHTHAGMGHHYELSLSMMDLLEPGERAIDILRQWDSRQLLLLLHQTGYLTLTRDNQLVPPNREVATHLAIVLLKPGFQQDEQRAARYVNNMYQALYDLRIPDLVAAFNSLLHQFPHQRFRDKGENPYNLLFDMAVMQFKTHVYHEMEHPGLQGQADTVLVWNDIALVVEFKYGDAATAARGLGQIRNKAYLRALRQPCTLYLGLSLQVKDRQVDAWICDGFTDTGQPLGRAIRHDQAWPQDFSEVWARWCISSPPNGEA